MQVALEIVHDHVPLQTALARCASCDGLYRKVMERIERFCWAVGVLPEKMKIGDLAHWMATLMGLDGTTSPLLERDTAFQDLPMF